MNTSASATTMIRPPLGKLHHYESRTALVRGTNHHGCGREPGTIESRGCNTFHGGINARGALWIRVDRDREAPIPPLHTLRHIGNQ